jgi:ABC-type transport system involved in multi-copper enzyme maturation permease subunit
MIQLFYIGKRTLVDTLHSGVFWGAILIAGFVCFALLYWGWRSVQTELNYEGDHASQFENQGNPYEGQGDPNQDRPNPDQNQRNYDPNGHEMMGMNSPFGQIDPRTGILWFVYVYTINFSNILSIFIMLGILARDIEHCRMDILLARPVTRGQIFFGKLFAGWSAMIIFLAIITAWTLICMLWGGMGIQTQYFSAIGVGTLQPLLIGAVTLLFSLWMKSLLAGFLGTITAFSSTSAGLSITYMLGVEVLRLDKAVSVYFKILPPFNVIGWTATSYLEKDFSLRVIRQTFAEMMPEKIGLYTHFWQVWAYLGIVIILGYLSLVRRQFT